MEIVLTGQPRSGKSQYAIKLILGYIKENEKREKRGKKARDIYCDIAGINAPDTPIKLPSVKNQWEVFGNSPLWLGEHGDPDIPDGYVCPPSGSIFIWDECHKVEWIKDVSGTLSKNPTAISVNEHGHEDYILIFITQFPQYIHTHLRGLAEYHFHVKRFNGLTRATVYKWNEFKSSPRTKTAIADAYEKEKFLFNKKYYNCYKSASAHDSMKFTMPKEWTYAILLVVALLSLMIWRFNNSPVKAMVGGETGIMAANKMTRDEHSVVDSGDSVVSGDGESLEQATNEVLTEEQEIDRLRAKYLDPHIIEMTKHEDIIPTMAIAMGDRCAAYNRYSERLNVDEVVCRKLLTSGGMPKSRLKDEMNSRHVNSFDGGGGLQVEYVDSVDLRSGS